MVYGLLPDAAYSWSIFAYDEIPNYSAVAYLDSVHTDAEDSFVVIMTVDADSITEIMSELWRPSTRSFGPVGTAQVPSSLTSNYWFLDVDPAKGGTYHWWNEHQTGDLAIHGAQMALIADSTTSQRIFFTMHGCPAAYVDSSTYQNVWHPNSNYVYSAYPPAPSHYGDWETMIYDELKYVMAVGDSVMNYVLFGDSTYRTTLGLKDSVHIGLSYGVAGLYDEESFQGTTAEFDSIVKYTFEAIDSIEAEFGFEVQIGGFGFVPGENDFACEKNNGYLDSALEYLAARGDSLYWISYQWRHNDPWSLTSPGSAERDTTAHTIRLRFNENGFDSSLVEIFAGSWHSDAHVTGLSNSRGETMEHKGEFNTEIGAVMVPVRLMDMDSIGQGRSYHEFLQGNSLVDFPLYDEDGGTAMATEGEAPGKRGLKKPAWNAMKMVGRLGNKRLAVTSDKKAFPVGTTDGTVNIIATKDTTVSPSPIQILIWSYMSPDRYIGDEAPYNRINYTTLYNKIYTDLENDSLFIDLTVSNLSSDFNNMTVHKWVLDKYNSNSWHWRRQLCWAMGLPNCQGTYTEGAQTLQDINNWQSGDNIYRASVDLELISQTPVTGGGTSWASEFGVLPYSIVLIELTPDAGPSPPPGGGAGSKGKIMQVGGKPEVSVKKP
jgi:hypothetical protein